MNHQMTFHLLWPRECFLADIANIIKRQCVHSFDVVLELAGGLESTRTLITLVGFLAVWQPVTDQGLLVDVWAFALITRVAVCLLCHVFFKSVFSVEALEVGINKKRLAREQNKYWFSWNEKEQVILLRTYLVVKSKQWPSKHWTHKISTTSFFSLPWESLWKKSGKPNEQIFHKAGFRLVRRFLRSYGLKKLFQTMQTFFLDHGFRDIDSNTNTHLNLKKIFPDRATGKFSKIGLRHFFAFLCQN